MPKRNVILAAALAATLALGACGDADDDGIVDDTIDPGGATTLVPDTLPVETMPTETTIGG